MSVQGLQGLVQAGLRAHQSGQLDKAAQIYRDVLAQDPVNPIALGNLGLLLGETRQFERAEELLTRLIARTPRFVDGYANLASVLHDQGKFNAAIDCAERGLKLSPDHRKLLNTLASSLSGAQRYEEAIALLTRITRAHPRYAKGHHYLGVTYTALGQCDQAVGAFDQAVHINSRDSESLVAAAECLMIYGRAEQAMVRIENALRLNAYDVRGLALKTLALAELGRQDEERWLADPQRFVHTLRLSDLGYGAAEVGKLNRSLSEFASNEASMREDPPEYATRNSWHTTTNLADSPNEAIGILKQFILYAFGQRKKQLSDEDPAHPFVRAPPEEVLIDLWAVKMTQRGKMIPHIHPGGWLSGVYYVDVPSIVDSPDGREAGWLKVGTPRVDFKMTRQPITRAVKPEPGMMVTFPSYFWHDTVPLPADNQEQRLCLAYDLHPLKSVPGKNDDRTSGASTAHIA
jgi:tetratricopeptide (TPR) repeat protein